MAKVINIKQETDYNAIIHLRNADGTDFNLVPYTGSSDKVLVKWRKKGTTTWTEKEISVYSATTGRLIWEWTTAETTDLSVGEWQGEFICQEDLVSGEFVNGTSKQVRFPNNPTKYQKIIVIESSI